MPWAYQYNSTLQILEGTFTGITTAHDLHALTKKFISLEKEKGVDRILIDTGGGIEDSSDCDAGLSS